MPRRHVHTAHKIPAAAAVRGPKVLLVTDSELQSGMSSLMLPAFLGQPNSLVLLTQSAREGSAAAALAAQPTPVQVKLPTFIVTTQPFESPRLTLLRRERRCRSARVACSSSRHGWTVTRKYFIRQRHSLEAVFLSSFDRERGW